MRQLFVAMIILMGSKFTSASECRLKRPIPIEGKLLERRFFEVIETNVPPRFRNSGDYRPGVDQLLLSTFPIKYNQKTLRFPGASIQVMGTGAYIGLGGTYAGDEFELVTRRKRIKSVRYFSVTEKKEYPKPLGEAFQRFTVGVRNKKEIVSLELTHPIYTEDHTSGYTRLVFTGRHQIICVTDAVLF